MTHLLFVFLLLISDEVSHSQGDPRTRRNPNEERWETVFDGQISQAADAAAMAEAQRKDAACHERDFQQKYNRLIHSLLDFGTSYNNGHVMDAKKIKAVREAWKELEKTDWFKSRDKLTPSRVLLRAGRAIKWNVVRSVQPSVR